MGCHRNYLFDHKIHYQYMFCCVSCSYPIIIISFSLQDTHLICLNYLYSNISVSKMFYFVIKFYMNKLIIVIVILYFTNVILYNCFPCIKEIWRFVHPRKVIFPEGNAQVKYDYFKGEQIFISPLCKGNECFIPPGQRFGEFCQMKSFGHLCLQNYYIGTSLELYRYMTKALNLEYFE
jgi:hypothetical protein